MYANVLIVVLVLGKERCDNTEADIDYLIALGVGMTRCLRNVDELQGNGSGRLCSLKRKGKEVTGSYTWLFFRSSCSQAAGSATSLIIYSYRPGTACFWKPSPMEGGSTEECKNDNCLHENRWALSLIR